MRLQYDKNRTGALEFEELRSVLGDLGVLVSHPQPCFILHSKAHHLHWLSVSQAYTPATGSTCQPHLTAQLACRLQLRVR